MSRKSLFLLSLAAVASVIIYRSAHWDFDWQLFFSSLWNVQPVWLLLSIVATFPAYFFRALRWQVLLNPLKPIRVGALTGATVIGFSAIFLLGRPGELVRPLWITRREQIPLTSSLATIVVERFLDSLMLIVLFGWSLLLVDLPATAGRTVELMEKTAWIMVASSIAAIVLLLVFRTNIDRILGFIRFPKLRSILKNFSEGLSFIEQRGALAGVIVHSIVVWVFIALQFWLMLLGMHFEFSISAATLVMVGAAIGSIAQIPGVGGGFQAGYIFCMTTFFIVPPEQAIATSLVAWVSSTVPTVLLGGLYMISHGLSLKDLKTAAVTE
jgi:glycosyltransferase 2 family protein